MIILDGSHGEGGGQIIRTALALSTITGKPFEIDNIRKGRCVSGLKHEHLSCIKALQDMCDAKVEGAELGSHKISFVPGKIKKGTYSIDIGTAGSITLLMQSLMIPSFFANGKVRFRIKGGTDVKWSQPVDYFNHVFLPHLRKYAEIDSKIEKRGYYPKGGGMVDISIKPKKDYSLNNKDIPKIELIEQGKLIQIKGISHASIDLEKGQVAERQASSSKMMLAKLNVPINIEKQYQETLSTGSGITLFAMFSLNDEFEYEKPIIIGSDSLGDRGKSAEEVGKEAAERLMNEIGYLAPVDEYLADNLVPFLGLFGGKIKAAKISNHCVANIYVIEKFLDKKFEINNEQKTISVE